MKKNCETCKHDDAEYIAYPFKTPCNECLSGKGCNDAPTKWEAAEHYKPYTNADRIRDMSDEELAKWLLLFVRSCGAVNGNNIEWADGMEEKMLDMLQQPAEGE